ncbi:MAG: hypothetical protein HOG18_00125 [Proteobacteria bacterium]|jgi:hypothetical protein|nr:hypothetical protein [Pseudomonadota bacterium]MBT4987731.1 hypothetical protein [Pseudomonadota bacterium]MBT5189474.1 hypothetical protein [Pseudomonadota bacterium]MBT6069437.1 hypothetical protein [Pseudomonadota bacterium]MBT6657332.1 hypothetical protein [Pseudomonadota bacterium]
MQNDFGSWTNYETYRTYLDIFEVNNCLSQAIDAVRNETSYKINADELRSIARDLFYERIGAHNSLLREEFLAEVNFNEIADFLNMGARAELRLDE